MKLHHCATCGKRTLTFGALMRHYLKQHPIYVRDPRTAFEEEDAR